MRKAIPALVPRKFPPLGASSLAWRRHPPAAGATRLLPPSSRPESLVQLGFPSPPSWSPPASSIRGPRQGISSGALIPPSPQYHSAFHSLHNPWLASLHPAEKASQLRLTGTCFSFCHLVHEARGKLWARGPFVRVGETLVKRGKWVVGWDERDDQWFSVPCLVGYCSDTSSSFPFSLYFCSSLFLGTLRCVQALGLGRRSETFQKTHSSLFVSKNFSDKRGLWS